MVAYSVGRSERSKPASLTMAWRTCPTRPCSGVVEVFSSIFSGVFTPASFSSFFALAMSRFGQSSGFTPGAMADCGEMGPQAGSYMPWKTTSLRVSRSIASSNASRTRTSRAIGVSSLPGFCPRPFTLPTLRPMPW